MTGATCGGRSSSRIGELRCKSGCNINDTDKHQAWDVPSRPLANPYDVPRVKGTRPFRAPVPAPPRIRGSAGRGRATNQEPARAILRPTRLPRVETCAQPKIRPRRATIIRGSRGPRLRGTRRQASPPSPLRGPPPGRFWDHGMSSQSRGGPAMPSSWRTTSQRELLFSVEQVLGVRGFSWTQLRRRASPERVLATARTWVACPTPMEGAEAEVVHAARKG